MSQMRAEIVILTTLLLALLGGVALVIAIPGGVYKPSAAEVARERWASTLQLVRVCNVKTDVLRDPATGHLWADRPPLLGGLTEFAPDVDADHACAGQPQ